MTQSIINDLLIILAAGLLAGLVCRRLRASVLIGYLLAGAFLGRGILGWVQNEHHELEHFAEAGVFLLLFSIGLEFSIDDMKRLGRNLVIGGAVQMSLVAFPIAAALHWYGMAWQPSVLFAAAIAFSSTVLVFKALSEWGQSQQSHGRRAIGILLFQDAALVPLLLLVPLLTGDGPAAGVLDYFILAAVSLLFVGAIIALRQLLAKWLIPLFANYRSPELVILFTVVLLGGVTLAAHTVGLPPAVGAFAAGLIFNGNRWTKQIDALVLPFRETFAAVFFIGLGLIFDPRLIWEEPILMGVALVSVIVIKTMSATIALKLTGLSWACSLGMGIGLAHVGEFAFVLVLLGVESGAISELNYNRFVAIAVGSLILTPVLMKAGLRFVHDELATEESPALGIAGEPASDRATVIGAGPIGRRVASQLETLGKDVCVIDLSPINLHLFAQEGFRTVAGDASDPEILALAEVPDSQISVVCVPRDETAIGIVKMIRRSNRAGRLIVRCRYQNSATRLHAAGADRVVIEETEAATAILRTLS